MIKRNLIIFGAGASYGSGGSIFYQGGNHSQALPLTIPPLGNELFNELKIFDPTGWGQIPTIYAEEFVKDFEKGMSIFVEKNPFQVLPLQRKMATYFFNFHPTPDNLYLKLAEKIKNNKWNGAIATLNYERLLEISLSHIGVKLVTGEYPAELETLELCFPHGYCNFFNAGMRASLGVKIDPSVQTYDNIIQINERREFMDRINNDSFPPIMSYYTQLKHTTSGANYIKQQRSRLNLLIEEATTIAIVGVRVRQHDSHIWAPLEKTDARIIYCAGISSGREFNDWKTRHRNNKDDLVLKGFFEESFEAICNNLEL